jgi:Restriction endonuclease
VSPRALYDGVSQDAEIRLVKKALERDAPARSTKATSMATLSERIAAAEAKKDAKKGGMLEKVVEDIFSSLEGLRVVKRNARLRAEELDLIIQNDLHTGFWRVAGSPLIVECKNVRKRVGAAEISLLLDKLASVGPDAKTGIMVAMNGITGNPSRDAVLKIREARREGRYILVLDRSDLQEIAKGASLGTIIERKYNETILI